MCYFSIKHFNSYLNSIFIVGEIVGEENKFGDPCYLNRIPTRKVVCEHLTCKMSKIKKFIICCWNYIILTLKEVLLWRENDFSDNYEIHLNAYTKCSW